MKYKQFIKNNIDIIKKYDNQILSINKVKYEDKKFYKNNLTKYKNNLRLDLKSKITELYSNKIYNLNSNIAKYTIFETHHTYIYICEFCYN